MALLLAPHRLSNKVAEVTLSISLLRSTCSRGSNYLRERKVAGASHGLFRENLLAVSLWKGPVIVCELEARAWR